MRLWPSFLLVFAMAFSFLMAACTRVEVSPPKDELVVALRDTPAFVQDEGGGAGNGSGTGYELELVERFAQEQGLVLRVIRVHDHSELITLLRSGKAHMAASAMVLEHLEGIRYSSSFRQAKQVLVQSADAFDLDEPSELADKRIDVLEGSPEASTLKAMNVRNFALQAMKEVPWKPFFVVEQRGLSEIDLLERVNARQSELAATDSLHFDIAVNFFPELQIAQVLPGEIHFAWAFPLGGDSRLFARAQAFIERVQQDGTLARLNDRYFGHIHRLEQYSIAEFLKRIGTVLPRLRADFEAAQDITGIDWRLLAALAYQESMWNPLATSPTNVRGIMMLTEETADRLKVSNRLDARQSIRAGARYLAEIIDALPKDIPQPDRTWMGMAAYNIGQGHMNGALAIAKTLKRDPRSWYEMKKVLPLMARPEYYKRLKSGRARGGEAVIMVENVRKYYDILSRFEPQHRPEKLSFDVSPPGLPVAAGPRLPAVPASSTRETAGNRVAEKQNGQGVSERARVGASRPYSSRAHPE